MRERIQNRYTIRELNPFMTPGWYLLAGRSESSKKAPRIEPAGNMARCKKPMSTSNNLGIQKNFQHRSCNVSQDN